MVRAGWVAWGFLTVICGAGNAMAAEEAKYTVVLKEESFELRRYEAHILAETAVDGDFDSAGNKAFGKLFKYISGENKTRETVDMTSPVGQEAASEQIDMTSPVGQQQDNGRWMVSFMMPASFTLETLPEPKDSTVILRQVPARHIAAIRYSGLWSEKGYLRNKEKLDAWVQDKALSVIGEPIWARYDPPFMPWFMRRNEILLPVMNPSKKE
jgi:hypothetical protein